MTAAPLDVIVRFHEMSRMVELDRCIFSLVNQVYRPLTIYVVTQRFDANATARVKGALAPMLRLDETVELEIVNYDVSDPPDARAALLNAGVARSRGRYLAFLDYDDVIYAEGYRKLVAELDRSGSAIAFGGVVGKHVSVHGDIIITSKKSYEFRGNGLLHLFFDNFCPIHSYVIDKSIVDRADLVFDTSLAKLEDYDFLIRFCAKYRSSFHLKDTIIGDYYLKDDGSNTVLVPSTRGKQRVTEWRVALEEIAERKRNTLVSSSVQRDIGRASIDPTLSVERLLEMMEISHAR